MSMQNIKCYLELLLYIANLDGNVDAGEMKMISDIASENGLSELDITEIKVDVLGGIITIKDIAVYLSPEDKSECICGLLDMCYADGKYTITEHRGMIEICDALEIDKDEFKKIEHEFSSRKNKQLIKSGADMVNLGLQKSIESGKFVGKSIAAGIGKIGSKVSDSFVRNKELKKQNQELRRILKENLVSQALKQKILVKLNSKTEALKLELQTEKARNKKNEEMIQYLQLQIDDLMQTLAIAEEVQIA